MMTTRHSVKLPSSAASHRGVGTQTIISMNLLFFSEDDKASVKVASRAPRSEEALGLNSI